MSGGDVVVVRRYTSAVEAQVAQLVLQAHGIPVVLLRDDAGGMLPSMHVLFPARLAVRAEDADLARRILDAEDAVDGEDGHEQEVSAGHEPPEDDELEAWRDDEEDGDTRGA